MNFYKLVDGYPVTYAGTEALDGFQEFTVDEEGIYSPTELNDAMVALEAQENEATFRAERDRLLVDVVDHYQKPLVWEGLTTEQQDKVRTYRQELLDSTINWQLPEDLII